jgi:hypothetical protein
MAGKMLSRKRQDAMDAARYRWLKFARNAHDGLPFIAIYNGSFTQWVGDEADKKIDKAMGKPMPGHAFDTEGVKP